ncbi:MAG TPA: FAD-dependent oxidoreductase [Pseudosphingobacterium sp.]|nr:FAD-dependent oxidoreductase [Pseudosphingobacterium sp.]
MATNYIVIGGGAAGIAAAYRILESSKTAFVHLFEASGIYGGRAKTDKYAPNGLAFDKGCVYIQDPKNPENPWPKIADLLNFSTVEEQAEYKLRINTGGGFQTVSVFGVPAINQIRNSISVDFNTNKESPNRTVTDMPATLSQNDIFALATSEYGPFTESTEPWMYIAADRAREGTEDWGGNLFVKKGLGTLVKTYGERIKTMYSIRFKETFRAVRKVKYNAKQVEVLDTNGVTHTADACIITLPVSVLASNDIQFTPNLPAAYTKALQALKLGSYKKLAVQVKSMPNEILDNVNYYLYNDNPKGIWQVYRLNFYPKNVLVVHASGDFAAQLDEMEDTDVFELFKACFSNAYSVTNIFTGKFSITNWSKNNYALGAYSYTAPFGFDGNDTTAVNARKQMAKPLLKRVYFAGEAYHLKAYGTLHGASIDGQEAADNAIRNLEDATSTLQTNHV